jgi:hypothetical protein
MAPLECCDEEQFHWSAKRRRCSFSLEAGEFRSRMSVVEIMPRNWCAVVLSCLVYSCLTTCNFSSRRFASRPHLSESRQPCRRTLASTAGEGM